MRAEMNSIFAKRFGNKTINGSIIDDKRYYEFAHCLSTIDPKWYVSASRLCKDDRRSFFKSLTSPFTIITPNEGIVDSRYEAVLPWFTPNQKAPFPPFYTNDWIGPLLDSVIKQDLCQDQRTILYGSYRDKEHAFFFEPDNDNPTHVALVFQNTILSPSFQVIADKTGGRHIINIDTLNVGIVDEFIIAETRMMQAAFKEILSTYGGNYCELTKRLHDCIKTFEKYHEVVRKRSDVVPVKSGSDHKNTIVDALERLQEISRELTDINPELSISIEIGEESFTIDGRDYIYTSDSIEHLERAIKITREKPFQKMVPRERTQAFGRLKTCFSQLHPTRLKSLENDDDKQ